MKENNVAKNFIYNISINIIVLIVPFITTPYISRVLGPEGIGSYSYAMATVTYFNLLAIFGSAIHGQRKIAYYKDDTEKLSREFWNIVFFRILSTVIMSILYIVYLFFNNRFNPLTIIVCLNIINVAADISWFFQGVEDFKKTTYCNLFVRLLCLLGIFIFVKDKQDVWKYGMIILGASTIVNILMWIFLKQYKISKVNDIHPFLDFKEMLLIFLPSIAIQVYTVLDKSMIGIITGSDYLNGCYEQSERISRLALTVVTSIGAVILSRVANLYHKNRLDEAKNYVYLGYRIVWMIGLPIMFGLISISSVFIPAFLGPDFYDSILLLCIFSVLVPIVGLAYITGVSFLIPIGKQNVYTLAVTVSAILNFIANLFLIPWIGATGAAIASICAEFIGVVIQVAYCSIKKHLSIKRLLLMSQKYWISSIGMMTLLLIIKRYFMTNLIGVFILVACGASVYFILLLLMRDELVLLCIKKTVTFIISKLKPMK